MVTHIAGRSLYSNLSDELLLSSGPGVRQWPTDRKDNSFLVLMEIILVGYYIIVTLLNTNIIFDVD